MSNTRFPSRFGKYILLDRLASGGMAEVYRAKVMGAEQFQRLVAIKCMLPNMVEDETFIVGAGDACRHPEGVTHSVEAIEDATILEIKSPAQPLEQFLGISSE